MKLYCPECKKEVDTILKMWYILCAECSLILKRREFKEIAIQVSKS